MKSVLALAALCLLATTANAAVCAKSRTATVAANNGVLLWGCVVEGNPWFTYSVEYTSPTSIQAYQAVIAYNFACTNNAPFNVPSKFNPGSASFPPVWTAVSVPAACIGPGKCTAGPVQVPAMSTPVCVMVVCTNTTTACSNMKVTIAAGSSLADVQNLDGSPAASVFAMSPLSYLVSALCALLAIAMF